MSRGDLETQRLRENIEDQLKRLVTQLADIEEMKEELDDDEYATTRQETVDQMKEFEQSLASMTAGNMSLVDEIGSIQLAIQSAIRSNTSPEIVNMFMRKENSSLRSGLAKLDSDLKLMRISKEDHDAKAAEILVMLEKLGEELTQAEKHIVQNKSKDMSAFVAATTEINEEAASRAAGAGLK